jgi:O-antigen/teichoic acid export membrane protein
MRFMALLPWWRSAVSNLSLKGLSLGAERASRFVVVVASARVLGEAAFGRFVFASTVTALLALGTDLGLGVWTTRTLARDRSDGGRIVRLGLALRGAASIPYALVVGAVALGTMRGESRAAMALLGAAALVNAFVDHFGAILRGYERFRDEARLNASRALITAGAGLVALSTSRSLVALCAGLAAASLVAAVQGLATILSDLPDRSVKPGGDTALARTALRESLPLWLASLLSVLYFRVDTLFLRSMAGDAELGSYGAAYRLFEGSMFLPAVVLAVAFPSMARAHAEDPPMRRLLERQVSTLLVAVGLLGAALGLVGGPWIVRVLFGADFARSVASLRVLALGLPILYLNYGLTHFLVARDLGRVTTWLAVMMLALNVTLDLALIPRGKGPGAAWATVLSEMALTACCLGALRWSASCTRPVPSVPGGAKRDRRAA